jgi:hypothetical protein
MFVVWPMLDILLRQIGVIRLTAVLQKNRTPTLGTLALLQVCPAAGLDIMGVVPRNGILK